MANDKKRGPNLRQDPLVERLRPDPSAPIEAQMLTGFLGRSVREGYWRVYLSATLNEYVEVAEEDVIDTAPVESGETMAGSIVWVKRTARLERTTVSPYDAQSEFLGGGITDSLMREMGPQGLGGGSPELAGFFTRTVSRLLCTRNTICTGWCCPKTGLTACQSAPCCGSPF